MTSDVNQYNISGIVLIIPFISHTAIYIPTLGIADKMLVHMLKSGNV